MVDPTIYSRTFYIEVNTINYHLREISKSEELREDSVIRNFRITTDDSKNCLTNFYDLGAIIAGGYLVNSYQTTQFRIWAISILKEYITKGFVLNDEMLKNERVFDKDYFNELLERIQDIWASERRSIKRLQMFMLSVDYDKNAPLSF
ncbi:hypothetical protein EZS27_024985 [termite gut metagenome]|uniref:Virulence protein n=1 Tax=termite gut metagenome TaxID=433724 RepID=A0A5J4QWF7_9ZZZZ